MDLDIRQTHIGPASWPAATDKEEEMATGKYASILIKKFFHEVFGAGNLDYIDTIIDPHYTFNGNPSSAARTKEWARKKRTKYRNLRFRIDFVDEADDSASFNWQMSGEENGELVVKKGFNQLAFRAGRCVSNRQTDSDVDRQRTVSI
jgi:hypothetical protein